MTREEAISVLERVAHTESKWPGTENTLEALDMAISALRAQQEHFREATKMVEPLENDVSDKDVGKNPGWISVKDRLPEIGELVLTLDKWGHIHDRKLYRFMNGLLVFTPDGLDPGKDVTHWMPLPEPPEEGTV